MKISVIVASYNHEKYIKYALDSILQQGLVNYEICIIDDGSKDNSVDVITSWIQANQVEGLVKFRTRKNRGAAETLNELFEMTQGDFIVPLASDDMLTYGSVMKRLEIFNAEPEVDFIFSDSLLIDKEGKLVSNSAMKCIYGDSLKGYNSRWILPIKIILGWSIVGSSWIARRGIFESGFRFDKKLMCEDWDFYLYLLKNSKMKFAADAYACYRVHGQNVAFDFRQRENIAEALIAIAKKNIKNSGFCIKILLIIRIVLLKTKLMYLKYV